MSTNNEAPWLAHYGAVPKHLKYENGSIYDMFHKAALQYSELPAYYFMGRKLTYRQLDQKILYTARAFLAAGIQRGDRVLLCLPNLPQTVDCFYALNRIGAISVPIHPLCAPDEIAQSLLIAKCSIAVVLDLFLDKFRDLQTGDSQLTIIAVHVSTELRGVKRVLYSAKMEQKKSVVTHHDWMDFVSGAEHTTLPEQETVASDPALILFTGGSTGVPKGTLLSNLNLNALALQTVTAGNAAKPGSTMLAIMPMFHGFGLGIGVHTALGNGGACILVPRFTPKSYVRILKRQRPNYIAGVPTIFEALLREPGAAKLDLSYLMGVFSGGDSMSPDLRHRVDEYLRTHGSPVCVREGYGLTECVSASCLTPEHMTKEGSIGIPFPDMEYKIVEPGTTRSLPVGEEGEICICGPTVMMGYVDNPEETAATLQCHEDGRMWLHTGDRGSMDADGFFYFQNRIKQVIVTSGYNVYPTQIERVLDAHEWVQRSGVLGVADAYRGQRVCAYVVLKPDIEPTEETRAGLMAYLTEKVAVYARPREIIFMKTLPTTLVGKVNYTELMRTAEKETLSGETL